MTFLATLSSSRATTCCSPCRSATRSASCNPASQAGVITASRRGSFLRSSQASACSPAIPPVRSRRGTSSTARPIPITRSSGASDGPCVIFMTGARLEDKGIVYPRSELANPPRRGRRERTRTNRLIFAPFPKWKDGRPKSWDGLPWGLRCCSTTARSRELLQGAAAARAPRPPVRAADDGRRSTARTAARCSAG